MSNDYLNDAAAWEQQRRKRRSSERKQRNRSPVASGAVTLSPPYNWSDQQRSFSSESSEWPYLSPDRQASFSVASSDSWADWSDTTSITPAFPHDQLVRYPHQSNSGGLFESVMGPDARGLSREEYVDIKQRISKIEDICLTIAKSGDSRDKRELADRKEQAQLQKKKRNGRTGNKNMAGAVYAQVLTDIIADIFRGFSVDFVQTVIGKVVGKAF
ncbi:uncharacterized protein J3D65DRAFT_692639 [Phyllosticta citribraziliensis]|uniref:Uncharacterized protein n=1 Tax=Phyllosticta citribraziliensis TaxID=989973 RepID=A0ABR1LXK3_9PEZI